MKKEFILSEQTISIVQDNKLMSMFDVVRFWTSIQTQRINPEAIKSFDDYRLILTHGAMPEVINFVHNNYYGLDPSKIIMLCNNVEIANVCMKHNIKSYLISEYIFTNEELYNIVPSTEKSIDCIFPGRPAKGTGLFEKSYVPLNMLVMYKTPMFPVSTENMPKYYNMSKCGLMTTETEGSCLSVGEMLSCGIPVVSVGIKTDTTKEHYYPYTKSQGVYDLQLPNTLGGRELWLDSSNSIFCKRNDDSIIHAIHQLLDKNLDAKNIRNDFLTKLHSQRVQFLYILKNTCDTIGFDFFSIVDDKMHEFINKPYGNSTITSLGWSIAKNYVKNTFQPYSI